MPDTQLLKFREQYPQYERLSDAAVLTRIHQKHYSQMPYERFVGKFEAKYGGVEKEKPKDFLGVVKKVVAEEPLSYGAESPMAAGGQLVGNFIDFIAQKLPTAAIPAGSPQYGIKAGEESFLQKLERGKTPGEFVPEIGVARLPSGQRVSADTIRPLVNFFGDIFWAAPPVVKIFKGLKFGKVTRFDVSRVRKLLETVPEVKKLGPISDEAIVELVRRGKGEVGKIGEKFVGKEGARVQRQLPQPEMTRVGGKQVPSPALGEIPKMHAEGILESQKKIGALTEPKPLEKLVVTRGKFAKVETTGKKLADAGYEDLIKEIYKKKSAVDFVARSSEKEIDDVLANFKRLKETLPKEEGFRYAQGTDLIKQASGRAKAQPPGLLETVAQKRKEIKPLEKISKVEPIVRSPKGILKLTPSQRNTLKAVRQEISGGEAGERILLLDEEGYQSKFIGKESTFPEYFKNKGLTQKESLKIIDNALNGKPVTEKQRLIIEDLNQGIRERFARQIKTERATGEVNAFDLNEGDVLKRHGETYKVKRVTEDGKVTIQNKETINLHGDESIKYDRGTLKSPEIETGKKLSYEKEFIKEQAKKGESATRPTVAARQAAKEKYAREVAAGKEDLFIIAEKKKQIDLLSGKEYSKKLFEAAKEDVRAGITETITKKQPQFIEGVTADPYKNVRQFLKENKLKLSDDELASINNFAKRLAKEIMPEAQRIQRFEEFLGKKFPKLKFESGVKPLEKIAQDVKAEKIATEPPSIDIGGAKVPLKEPRLHEEVFKKTTKGMANVLLEHGIKRDKLSFPTLKEQYFHYAGKFNWTYKNLEKYGVSKDDFESIIFDEITHLGRMMNQLSQQSKLLGKSKELSKAVEDLSKLASEPGLYEKAGEVWKRIDNIRRGLLVSQLSTAARNAISQSGRIGLDVIDESIEIALGKVFNAKSYDLEKFSDAFKIIGRLGRKNKKILEDVMKVTAPKEFNRLFMHYASDVTVGTKFEGALSKVEKGVEYLNWANKLQEFTIRRAAFIGKLNEELGKRGTDFASIYKRFEKMEARMLKKYGADYKGSMSGSEAREMRGILKESILKEDIEKSVDFALEMTFAENPAKGTLGHHILQAVNKMAMLPTGTGTFPFIRFAMNAIKFNFQHSPLGILRLTNPKIWKTGKAAEAASRALTGSVATLIGYGIRNSQYAGERWYEVKVNGKFYDTRPYNPFAAYFFLGEVMKRVKEGDLGNMTFKDWANGILGSNLRAGIGVWAVDKLIEGIYDPESFLRFKRAVSEYGANLVSGFATPIQQITDFISEFDDETAKLRETRPGFWDKTIAKTPWTTSLPERESPTREATPKKEAPLLKMLTGFLQKEDKNLLEKELDKHDFSYPEIFPKVRDLKLDQATRKYMGEGAEKFVIPILEGEYQNWTKAKQGYVLSELMSKLRQYGKFKAIGNDEEARAIYIDIKKRFLDQPKRKRKFLQEIQQGVQ